MSYRFEKNNNDQDLVFSGWENGVARSPLSGVANLQNVNIATENKEVMASYNRFLQSMSSTASSGTITPVDSTTLGSTGISSQSVKAGFWITVTVSTITGLVAGNYYVNFSDGAFTSSSSQLKLATTYNGSSLSGLGATGTATFILLRSPSKGVASDTERYTQSSGVVQYRYYILDDQGLVWVYDTALVDMARGLAWFLPDFNLNFTGKFPTGLAVLDGWVHIFGGNSIFCVPTTILGLTSSTNSTWSAFTKGSVLSTATSRNPHFAYTTKNGEILYTDGPYVGRITPNSGVLTGATTVDIQSFASYTAVTTTGTMALISGVAPADGVSTLRVPATFIAADTLPTALQGGQTTAGGYKQSIIFYISYSISAGTFEVFAAATGGSAIDIATGSVGTQYFNTYCPVNTAGKVTIQFDPTALTLNFDEVGTSIVDVGNRTFIGTQGNTVYPWNNVDSQPFDAILLPENNTAQLLGVNNMVYIFAGNKGNIYISNGSTASLAISVPDYCAGIAGTPSSYREPYFIWGGAMYLRGRIYFSIQDQTSTKTGNCGGIWSFVPTQNFFYGQDTGQALRLENQNSYGTYNGAASVLLASRDQQVVGPQYWSMWYSSVTSVTYGIDMSAATVSSTAITLKPVTTALIETDLAATGTLLNKKTFEQIEYKLSTPLASGDSIAIGWRTDSTSAFTSAGTAVTEGSTELSGYFVANFEKGQWLQLQITLTTSGSTSSSFDRLVEVRVR